MRDKSTAEKVKMSSVLVLPLPLFSSLAEEGKEGEREGSLENNFLWRWPDDVSIGPKAPATIIELRSSGQCFNSKRAQETLPPPQLGKSLRCRKNIEAKSWSTNFVAISLKVFRNESASMPKFMRDKCLDCSFRIWNGLLKKNPSFTRWTARWRLTCMAGPIRNLKIGRRILNWLRIV